MKLYLSKEFVSQESYTHIKDINLLDIMCDDMEADEIIVDNFLNQFTYAQFGQVLNKIATKLRLGGMITVSEYDIDFLCNSLTVGKIDQQEFNELIFTGGPAQCLFKVETVVDLLQQSGLRIVEKFIDSNDLCIVKAVR